MRFGLMLIFVGAFVARAQFGGLGGGTTQQPSPDVKSLATGTGFKPWLSVNGYYARTLDDQPVDGAKRGQFFPTLSGGIGGWKNWNNRGLAASYTGSATRRSYLADSTADSWQQNHMATVSYSQQVSRRFSFSVSEAGGRTYGGFGYGSAFGSAGVPGLSGAFGPGSLGGDFLGGSADGLLQNGIVDNEFFASQVTFSVTSGNVGYRLGQRTMVSGYGEMSFVRRELRNHDQRVYGGGGSISHQFSKKLEMGLGYARSEIRYPNVFGGVSNDSFYVSVKARLSPLSTFSASGGGALPNSTFVGSVPLDPAIAAIIGASSTLQVTKTRFLTPVFNASFDRTFGVGALSISGGRTINPGNGMLYAGVRDNANVGFSRTLNDRIGVTFIAGYYRMSGRFGTLALTDSIQASGLVSVKLARTLSLTMQGGARTVNSSAIYTRKEAFAGVGLAWTPTDRPFTF